MHHAHGEVLAIGDWFNIGVDVGNSMAFDFWVHKTWMPIKPLNFAALGCVAKNGWVLIGY